MQAGYLCHSVVTHASGFSNSCTFLGCLRFFRVETHARWGPGSDVPWRNPCPSLCHSGCDRACPGHWHRLSAGRNNDPLSFSRLSVSQMHISYPPPPSCSVCTFFSSVFLDVVTLIRVPGAKCCSCLEWSFGYMGNPRVWRTGFKSGKQIKGVSANAPDLHFVPSAAKIST